MEHLNQVAKIAIEGLGGKQVTESNTEDWKSNSGAHTTRSREKDHHNNYSQGDESIHYNSREKTQVIWQHENQFNQISK